MIYKSLNLVDKKSKFMSFIFKLLLPRMIMKKFLLCFLYLFVFFTYQNILASTEKTDNIQTEQTETTTKPSCPIPQPSLTGSLINQISEAIKGTKLFWKEKLSSIFDKTGSSWIRIIICFFLGILLSLTPCIYPMIPITIGVLQINQNKTALQSFLMASSYTVGISTTFAIFGFISSLGSCVFGQLQGSPWIVIPFAAFLLYFAFSMFDFYEIYIPKFLRPKNRAVKGGSYFSAFIFGVISGTVSSPCLSPGLLLILDYVSNISINGLITGYMEGFLLLFIFGIGSSLPLLIIGTFSGAMNLLPKAGMWMVEVKKLFGLMLISMALYHLSHLERFLPWLIFVWIIVLSLFALGLYYFKNIRYHDSRNMKVYKAFMGTLLIIIGCLFGIQGSTNIYELRAEPIWLHDYKLAHKKALEEKKPLLIKIGATYCSACKVVDKKIFGNEKIASQITNYIPLEVESDLHEEVFKNVNKLFGSHIKGFPTILIVNPKKETVITKWTEDILDYKDIDNLVLTLNEIASDMRAKWEYY